MPLQNRVDPLGEIHAIGSRGTFTGNRGIIHNPDTKTLLRRRWTLKAWIICLLRYKSHHRQVMSRNTWTELFFLDEATALAAGHRPCFYCRRQDAIAYARAFRGSVNGEKRAYVGEMDRVLHAQRAAAGASLPPISPDRVSDLPDGVAIQVNGRPYMLLDGQLRVWTFEGYGEKLSMEGSINATWFLVTPMATVQALANGYKPTFHPSAYEH